MHFTPILAAVVLQYQALAAPVLVPVQASTNGGGPGIRTGTVRTIQYPAHAAPVVVPSQVVSPVSSGAPVYPPRVPRRERLHASRQVAWFFDAQWDTPAAAEVPELPPSSPSVVVRRKHRTACYVQAEPHFGVPVNVPVMSWTGWYDWRMPHWAKRRHASQAPHYFSDWVLFPDVVVAPDQSVAVFPDRVARARRVPAFPQASAPVFVADVQVTVPALSWAPEYPDRLYPRRGLAARHQRFFEMWPDVIPVTAVSHVTGGRGYYVVPPRRRDFVVPPRRRKFTV